MVGRRRYAGRWRSVCSRLASEVKAAEQAMAVAARSVEVVMAAKGAAVTVAAKEEVAKEEAAVAEETVLGACVVRQGAGRRPDRVRRARRVL